MYVLETGFAAVGRVVLGAGGAVAAAKRWPETRSAAELRAWTAKYGNDFGIWEAKLWSAPGAEPQPVQVEAGEPFGLAIDPFDGTLVHGNVRYGVGWSPNVILEPNVVGPPRSFALSPDGKRLILGCGRERFRGKTTPAQLHGFTRKKVGRRGEMSQEADAVHSGDGFEFSHVAFFADGKRFASVELSKVKRTREHGEWDVPILTIRDAKTLEMLGLVGFSQPAEQLVVCGERMVIRRPNGLFVCSADELLAKPLEVKTGRATLTALAADVHGRCLFTAAGGKVTRWDTSSWKVANTYDWKAGPITYLAVAPDGLTAAAGTATGKVVVWDVE
ncbi:MAG: WD40 repeat domain-containing protein [Gemmataceae bacterium]